jgi:hypothetical protein
VVVPPFLGAPILGMRFWSRGIGLLVPPIQDAHFDVSIGVMRLVVMWYRQRCTVLVPVVSCSV